jgi:hypothetical protein
MLLWIAVFAAFHSLYRRLRPMPFAKPIWRGIRC